MEWLLQGVSFLLASLLHHQQTHGQKTSVFLVLTVEHQERCFTDIIKPCLCQADMCKVTIVIHKSLSLLHTLFQLTEDLANNDVGSSSSVNSPIANVRNLQCRLVLVFWKYQFFRYHTHQEFENLSSQSGLHRGGKYIKVL